MFVGILFEIHIRTLTNFRLTSIFLSLENITADLKDFIISNQISVWYGFYNANYTLYSELSFSF